MVMALNIIGITIQLEWSLDWVHTSRHSGHVGGTLTKEYD
jgi:hypothetical protein